MPPEQKSRLLQLKETSRLRAAMSGKRPIRYWWMIHGRPEMTTNRITASSVERLCRKGSVVWVESDLDELWHVEGSDLDGRSIRVVVALIEEENETVIKVVTAMIL